MQPLRDPEHGHVIMTAAQCIAFTEYLARLDDETLLSTARDWSWLAGQGKGPEAEWKARACEEELRRRAG